MTPARARAEQVEVPEDVRRRVEALCLALPEVTVRVDESRVRERSTAWSYDIRRRSFCLLVAEERDGRAVALLALRSDPVERAALLGQGFPYLTSRAGSDRITVVITDHTGWDEVGELIIDSYRRLAPEKLIALLS